MIDIHWVGGCGGWGNFLRKALSSDRTDDLVEPDTHQGQQAHAG